MRCSHDLGVPIELDGDARRPVALLLHSAVAGELSHFVAQRSVGDPSLHYLDGAELYGKNHYAELPLETGRHPNAAAHQRIGEASM